MNNAEQMLFAEVMRQRDQAKEETYALRSYISIMDATLSHTRQELQEAKDRLDRAETALSATIEALDSRTATLERLHEIVNQLADSANGNESLAIEARRLINARAAAPADGPWQHPRFGLDYPHDAAPADGLDVERLARVMRSLDSRLLPDEAKEYASLVVERYLVEVEEPCDALHPQYGWPCVGRSDHPKDHATNQGVRWPREYAKEQP